MTTHPEDYTSIHGVANELRQRLQQYIESAYFIRDPSVVAERRALLQQTHAIAREPFLETTPAYEAMPDYQSLGIPPLIAQTLDTLARWEPGIGIFPHPYRHQAEAFTAFFNDRCDLIVATGTGSGKTETFLIPILGSLLQEAAQRNTTFHIPGIRALILYPMNALVNDQITRLRRLFGDERLRTLFDTNYGRHPTFGSYTSRTPYPGLREQQRDERFVTPLIEYYLNIESHPQLANELKQRGRWPAKDLAGFFGREGKTWEERFLTQPGDCELLTRHEMHQRCPDILVTNYSMLEYMLVRPIERTIFAQTQHRLTSDPHGELILVIDEAHLYNGTTGTEVAYLIRRLQARLGIPRERLRCILTSASFGSNKDVESKIETFATQLTGAFQSNNRRFHFVRGHIDPQSPDRHGSLSEAEVLATFHHQRFTNRAIDREAAVNELTRLAVALHWPTPPGYNHGSDNDADLRSYLFQQMCNWEPMQALIKASTGKALSLDQLSRDVFPDTPTTIARRAVEALITLGTYAHNGQRPLLQSRLHLLFRGLPSLWACINPRCPDRLDHSHPNPLLGRLYTEPRTHCTCGGRVYEVLMHRDCGAVFLRVFGTGKAAQFYWHEEGGRLMDASPLQEDWLIVETPLPNHQKNRRVEAIWIDIRTGRVETDLPGDTEHYRQCWRPVPMADDSVEEDQENNQSATSYPFKSCPCCNCPTPYKVSDLATRGERPFANLIYTQFVLQAPVKPYSQNHPNGGRKTLIFSDGRQKAARLARDLPRELELDAFRQTLACAVERLAQIKGEATTGSNLYTAFVAVCRERDLYFFDREFDSQSKFIDALSRFERYYDSDLEYALEDKDPFGKPPFLYQQHLLYQLAHQFYDIYKVGVMIPTPSKSSLRKILQETTRAITQEHPESTRLIQEISTIADFWIQQMLSRGAFDCTIPEYYRKQIISIDRAPTQDTMLLQRILSKTMNKEQIQRINKVFFNVLTERHEGRAYLNPEALALKLAIDSTWYRCQQCGNLQHAPLLGGCSACQQPSLIACPPDEPTIAARLDYFRQPVRAALQGQRLFYMTVEEHTAQLGWRDFGRVYATTEEFELRFQDIALDQTKPPIDALSCTTTMEVGIDIGALSAIGLRNVPPQRANYQQRAGRAGRRNAAIATVITYAEHQSYDQYYYHYPETMISGEPPLPYLDIYRPTFAQRHIHAFLLQSFFHQALDQLSEVQQREIVQKRSSLPTALGTCEEFFRNEPDVFSFNAFQQWVAKHVLCAEGSIVREISIWLPAQLLLHGNQDVTQFVQDTAQSFLKSLERLREEVSTKKLLLDALFEAGLLPSYAFPTNLVSFFIFDRDTGKIKEQPQQNKLIALSEYAPGRTLVVNKETYRVGGIYHPYTPIRKQFQQLQTYVFCKNCAYVRLVEPLKHLERCPICKKQTLEQRSILDPDGFSPEEGLPVSINDDANEISYTEDIQFPLPLKPEQFRWQASRWKRLKYTHAENQQFVVVNTGPKQKGFKVCEECGAAVPATIRLPSEHRRPYLTPPEWNRNSNCRGKIQTVFIGTTFRSDLVILRGTLAEPFKRDPLSPELKDALFSVSEALALAASRELDIDPAELSAGYRFLAVDSESTTFDLFLVDTASGGAGYSVQAGRQIDQILLAALHLLEHCPQQCERSCPACLRRYGNRMRHSKLDRHLAAHLLRYLMYGELPPILQVKQQRQVLDPLRRFFELEGWSVRGDAAIPLIVSKGQQVIRVGLYPALLNPASARFEHPLKGTARLVSEYTVLRDLPLAYRQVTV